MAELIRTGRAFAFRWGGYVAYVDGSTTTFEHRVIAHVYDLYVIGGQLHRHLSDNRRYFFLVKRTSPADVVEAYSGCPARAFTPGDVVTLTKHHSNEALSLLEGCAGLR